MFVSCAPNSLLIKLALPYLMPQRHTGLGHTDLFSKVAAKPPIAVFLKSSTFNQKPGPVNIANVVLNQKELVLLMLTKILQE